MLEDSEKRLILEVREILQDPRLYSTAAPDYLKTRIMAYADASLAGRGKVRFWKIATLCASSLSLALLVLVVTPLTKKLAAPDTHKVAATGSEEQIPSMVTQAMVNPPNDVSIVFSATGERLEAVTRHPLVVRMETAAADYPNASLAEIYLPAGVYIYETTLSKVSRKQELRIELTTREDKPSFSFVILAETGGPKIINVKFFDNNNTLIAERSVPISFVERKE